jgi:hypothetical protein
LVTEECILLDIFGQTRHEVLAVLVQRLGLLMIPVGGVHDGDFKLRRRVAGGILAQRQY